VAGSARSTSSATRRSCAACGSRPGRRGSTERRRRLPRRGSDAGHRDGRPGEPTPNRVR
jgi:hypothetical protein